MKITVEHMDLPENEVILRCPALDEEMLGVLSLLRSGLQRLCVWDDSRRTTLLTPDEVFHLKVNETAHGGRRHPRSASPRFLYYPGLMLRYSVISRG